MPSLDDLVKKKRLSQQEFATLFNINQSTVSKYSTAGVLREDGEWIEWARQLIRHLMEVSANRRTESNLDVVQESARLKKLQGDRIQAELKQTMREVLHFEPLSLAFSSTLVTVKTKLLGLPYKLTARASSVTSKDVSIINDVISEVLTDLSESAPFPRAVAARIEELENSMWAEAGVDRKAILNGSTPEVMEHGEKENGTKVLETRA